MSLFSLTEIQLTDSYFYTPQLPIAKTSYDHYAVASINKYHDR